jgi:hypothetical protein
VLIEGNTVDGEINDVDAIRPMMRYGPRMDEKRKTLCVDRGKYSRW